VTEQSSPADVREALDTLSRAKIFFGHQSVGANIIEGLEALQAQSPGTTVRIVDWQQQRSDLEGAPAFFAHAKLGENGDPAGKTAEFAAALRSGLADRVDIAFHKYCFVDIDASTDVDRLFVAYKEAMERLHVAFPTVTFVHVTTPLMSVQSGPRAIIKKLIGRTPDYYDENIARGKFNELMRREYGGARLFDLAALESSRPGEAPEAIEYRNEKVYALRPEYTFDGGHLTESARKRIASELVVFLARTLERRSTLHTTTAR
jgi:hypothetical protein